MTLQTFDIGDTVRLSAVFTSTAGAFLDPDSVAIAYRDPSGNEATVTSASTLLVHPSSGTYHYDLFVDQQGVWRWRSYSTGNIDTAGESEFVARKRWVGS